MTKRSIRSTSGAAILLAIGLGLVATPAVSADPKAPAAPPQSAKTPAAPPLPADVLRSMSAFLAKQKAFTFHAEIEYDHLLPGGPKVRLAGALDMGVSRPGSLHADFRDDVMDRLIWFENGRVTIVDPVGNTYTQVATPKDIDGTVAKLEKDYGVTLPLGEIAESDPYAVLTRGVESAYYVGIHNVEGVFCHHVVLQRKDLQIQVFVEVGAKPLPRKLVFEYLSKPGSPQYTASLTDWSLAAPKADLFVPKLPKGAGKVDFLPLPEGKR